MRTINQIKADMEAVRAERSALVREAVRYGRIDMRASDLRAELDALADELAEAFHEERMAAIAEASK